MANGAGAVPPEQGERYEIPRAAEFITPEEIPKRESPTVYSLKTAGLFLLAGLAVYLIIVAPSLWVKISYFFSHLGEENVAEKVIEIKPLAPTLSGAVSAALKEEPVSIIATTEEKVATLDQAELELEDNHLLIPKIGVKAPIVWNTSSDEQIMLDNLRHGVVHYGFTSKPNTESGNVFITGHSSYYWWDNGQYKTVFALLNQLVPGDQVFLQYQGLIYVYEVEEAVVVRPSQVEVTDQTDEPYLSLMTCTPVGTALNRLVVKSKLARAYPVEETFPTTEPTTPSPAVETPSPDLLEPIGPGPTNRDVIELIPGLGF
jgi:sortase A